MTTALPTGPTSTTVRRLTLGHSPDPDDAFMFYALAEGKIDTGRWAFQHVLQDIQTLNDRALRAELDITAISIHAYPYVADTYVLTNCGSSMGDGYGPMVVAREPWRVADLRGKRIAVPGLRTTAFLALQLLLAEGDPAGRPMAFDVVMFDQILQHVEEGRADAGLIIHEGQLTYGRHKLHMVVDLGAWWKSTTGLPLPLGGNVIRRDLGRSAIDEIAGIIKRSIEFSLAHRSEAVAHALRYARDLDRDLADRFVGMYVNEWTLDYGETGRRAVRELLRQAYAAGFVPEPGEINFV